MKIDSHHVSDAYIALIGQRSQELAALTSQICIERFESVPSNLPFTQPELIFLAGSPLSQPCLEALGKASVALGYNLELVAHVHLLAACDSAALNMGIELIDPEAIVAVDERSGVMLNDALKSVARHEGVQVSPAQTQMVYLQGRRVLNLPSFATQFNDEHAKRRLWDALCQVAKRRVVY